jgi:hypothetical protein
MVIYDINSYTHTNFKTGPFIKPGSGSGSPLSGSLPDLKSPDSAGFLTVLRSRIIFMRFWPRAQKVTSSVGSDSYLIYYTLVQQLTPGFHTIFFYFHVFEVDVNMAQHWLKNFFPNFFVKIGYVTLNPSQMECSRKCKDKFG